MKFTKGEWYAVGSWVEHDDMDDGVADICNCDLASMGQEHLKRTDEEVMANAQLISASPELLQSLQWLLTITEDDGSEMDQARMCAQQAINKALGEGWEKEYNKDNGETA